MKRYHLQIDDGRDVSIDEHGQPFPSDDVALAMASEMAGRLLAEVDAAGDRRVEVKVETDQHYHLGTVTALMRRKA